MLEVHSKCIRLLVTFCLLQAQAHGPNVNVRGFMSPLLDMLAEEGGNRVAAKEAEKGSALTCEEV